MKRITALILSMLLVIAMLAGCGKTDSDGTQSGAGEKESTPSTEQSVESSEPESQEPAEKTYDEHITISAVTAYSFTNAIQGVEYGNDDWYKWFTEKFNVDFDLWACSQDEVGTLVPLWINNGTMPDFIVTRGVWSLPAYYNYVDQGLIKALPADLKERWPNIGRALEASGMDDLLLVDGQYYAIPGVCYLNLTPELVGEYVPGWPSLYFRKDWAKQVGMENMGENGYVTMTELHDYLAKVKEAGLCEVGYSNATSSTMKMFYYTTGVTNQHWKDTGSEFVWVPGTDEYFDLITDMQNWWNEGLLDPDFVNVSSAQAWQKFLNGQAAATTANYVAESGVSIQEEFASRGIENCWDGVCGVAAYASDDGTAHIDASLNGTYPKVFRPDLDDATLERILDILDYIFSPEGELSMFYGIPGEQWEFEGDDSVKSLVDEGTTVGMQNAELIFVGINNEDYTNSKYCTTIAKESVDRLFDLIKVKKSGELYYEPPKYSRFHGESKDNYSVAVTNPIIGIVCNNLDVESSWKSFIEDNRGMWEPLLNDLNATYYGK